MTNHRFDDPTDDPTPDTIVVGVDGTETALSAVRWAAREATTHADGLRVVHAAPYAAGPQLHAHAQGLLRRAVTVARRAAPELTVTADLLDPDPVPALLEASERAAMLVLGVPDDGVPGEVPIGSVSPAVTARSSCPVVLVHREGAGPGHEVVVGIGDPSADAGLIGTAHRFAARHGAPVRIVHAGRVSYEDRTLLEELAARWDRRDSTVEVSLETTHRRPAVVLASRARGARLVVVGQRSRARHVLTGSTARALLRDCHTPVMVARARPVPDDGVPALAGDPHRRSELW